MRESIRSVCYLVILVAVIVSIVMWTMDRPDQSVWIARIASPAIVLAGFLVLYWVRPPADAVPDYLAQKVGAYFDRGGFCFGFGVSARDGCCFVDAYFQNRHEGRCRGRIAMRPAKGFFLTRPDFDEVAFDIECVPAAFGVASVPIPVPSKSQGKAQKFEVGAFVHYPEGKGRMLRHRPGLLIRTDSAFGNSFHTGLQVAGALGGMVVLTSPASVTLNLPSGVAELVPEGRAPEVKTLWKLGDPTPSGGA